MKNQYKHYLVSYSHEEGHGNMFFRAKPALDIREAEKEISKESKYKKPVIITINEITKWQYDRNNP